MHHDQRLEHRRRNRKEVLRVLKPLGIDAAVKAIETQTSETTAAQRQLELSLQQTRYEAAMRVDNTTPSIRQSPRGWRTGTTLE